MSCPICGDFCHCEAATGRAVNQLRSPRRFEPAESTVSSPLDPAVDNASEPRFAGTQEEGAKPRFIVAAEDTPAPMRIRLSDDSDIPQEPPRDRLEPGDCEPSSCGPSLGLEEKDPAVPPEQSGSANEDAWRTEVAARVNKYRSRRRAREPKYPSLRLRFEAPPEDSPAAEVPEQSAAFAIERLPVSSAATVRKMQPAESAAPETAKIIPFPRSATATPVRLDELAEPVMDRPRILEVPEVAPPPPALGGILMEPVEQPQNEKRPGIDMPLQSAPLGRRVLAALADGVPVAAACALSGYIFFRVTNFIPIVPQAMAAAAGAGLVFWSAYQYLLMVYCGSTPGLRLARLRLCRFDGSPAHRRVRRWRVLASLLSALSLGLGYAWCFLDEDALCWHDRITRTYLAPKP